MFYIDIVSLGIITIYFLFTLYLIYGSYKQTIYPKTTNKYKISILVPAKDEENNIERCLDALLNQSISDDLYEIIVINDNSNDRTENIAKVYEGKCRNLRVLNVPESIDTHLVGKSKAISIGVKDSKYDIVLICDADCKPNFNWVDTILSAFTDRVGVVSGFTLLEGRKQSIFNMVQNVDWIMLQGAASGAVGINQPISCIGSNFAFRKKVYYEVGGYESLPFSITEDLLLYKTISKRTNWEFVYPLSADSVNVSDPMPTLPTLYQQRKRWAIGSLGIGGFGLFVMLLNGTAHILPLFSLFIYNQIELLLFVMVTDFILFAWILNKLKRIHLLKSFLNYQLYYYFNILVFPILFLFDRKVIWKNRVYSKGKV